MIRYLKAAFWASPDVPGLGKIPWNAVGLAGVGLLGFGHPGFWFLGLGLEAAYLYALTMNKRFRRLIDAEERYVEQTSVEVQRQAIVAKLIPPAREQLTAIERKCERILQLHTEAQTDEFVAEGNREALQKLSWLYLKLLLARQNLHAVDAEATAQQLRLQIRQIEHDLANAKLTPSLRESKEATHRILLQRLNGLERREQSLAEIDSDLLRIEAQVDLAVDQAGLRGKAETITANIDLVSQLLDDSMYGDSGASIAALESTYGTPQQQ